MATLKTLILLCCVVVFCSAQDAGLNKAGARIWGGFEADPGQFKWQVGIGHRNDDGTYGNFYGGALISKQWVLSDSYAVEFVDKEKIDVILGATQIHGEQNGRIITKIDKIVYNHPKMLSLIKLVAPVEFNDYIGAIRLPKATDDLEEGAIVWASGWGYVNDSNIRHNELKYVDLTVTARDACKQSGHILEDYYVCTDGSEDKCAWYGGDMGGALVQYINDDWTHVGVINYVIDNGCHAGEPTANIRTSSILEFIYTHTGPISTIV